MIPRLIHLCWYGPDPIPDAYRKILDRWQLLVCETNWQVIVWTDEANDFLHLRNLMWDAGAKPVQVCNVMRLAILYLHGGVYLDFDIIPLRLPQFDIDDRMNLFYEVDGNRNVVPALATLAAPARDPHVRELFWMCLQETVFNPVSRQQRYKGGNGVFPLLPAEWFDGIEKRNVNHFAPVNWAQARVLNIVEKYDYAQWLALSESFLCYPQVYGVHTYDSSWIYKLNERIERERNPDNGHTTESEQVPCRSAIPSESPGH